MQEDSTAVLGQLQMLNAQGITCESTVSKTFLTIPKCAYCLAKIAQPTQLKLFSVPANFNSTCERERSLANVLRPAATRTHL